LGNGTAQAFRNCAEIVNAIAIGAKQIDRLAVRLVNGREIAATLKPTEAEGERY
jgi:hypothetical protein